MADEEIVSDILSEIQVLDRDSFKELIQSSCDSKDEDSASLGILLYTNFIKLYSLNQQERDEWLDLINSINDDDQRAGLFVEFFSLLLPDNGNDSFCLKYLEFLKSDLSKRILPEDTRLAEAQKYSNSLDFMNSQKLFAQHLEIINQSTLDEATKLQHTKEIYLNRLGKKHHQIDETYQNYSQLITKSSPSDYEPEMSKASEIYQHTKNSQLGLESFIYKQSDRNSKVFWLSSLNYFHTLTRREFNVEELISVFENAIAEFDDVEIWKAFLILYNEYHDGSYHEDYIKDEALVFLSRYLKRHPYSALPYIELFRGIPARFSEKTYSGVLARFQYLLENHDPDFQDWKDLAVSHIRLLFEMKDPSRDELVEKYFSKAIQSDDTPFHSVERFVVNCYEKYNGIAKARQYLRLITNAFPSQSEGWLISYYFERKNGDPLSALKILSAAINRVETLDWPDRIIEEYSRFGELYEANYGIISNKVAKKRRLLHELAAQQIEEIEEIEADSSNKRRHVDESMVENENGEDSLKKRKTITHVRNREQLTVSVSNIPLHISEKQVLNFFKDCGEVQESKTIATNDFQQVHLEFTNEQDVLRALSKDYKKLGGSELRVQRLLKSTVWVTNYPPSYTQLEIERAFSAVGDIVSVRLPSLKSNSQRRFCYIEYLNSESAMSAVNKFDGTMIDGFKLKVKISDPTSKQSRCGATEEGREVFVCKLDFYKVTTSKVKQLFEKYGTIESVHLPLSPKNKEQGKKHDGYGFIVFSKPDEAQSSLNLNLVSFEGRAIEVSISKKKSQKEKRKEKFALSDYRNAENVLALKDLPDTINSAQLKDFFKSYGEIDDVILEQNGNGALIVFANSKEAGDTALKVDGTKIGNYDIQLTTVSELKKLDKRSKSTNASTSTSTLISTSTSFIPSSLRRKPKLPTATVSKPVTSTDHKTEDNNQLQKTNDDFRAMLLGKKK